MSIVTENIPHLQNIQLKYKKTKYPQCKDPNLPRLFFVALFVGSRRSGKTYNACQLLKAYENFGIYQNCQQVIQRIILISPTQQANPCFKALKNLDEDDIHENYSDSLLLDIVENIKEEKHKTEEYIKELTIWKKFLKAKNLDDMNNEEILHLHKMGFIEPIKPRFDSEVANFLVLDDLIGSTAFKQTGQSALNHILLKCRHLGISFLIMSQNLKAIPKTIRTNTSVFVMFRYGSRKVICDDLYEEVSNLCTEEEFLTLYDHATQTEHDALIIDFSQPRNNRFKRNWHEIIKII
jgi:hypothetical protein